ncbi:MAG TPA: hypothetical protein VM533_20895 [Fimbriiglobus sp.]|jgi:hypothetical protein|nr:hypothetical protein [Fimbriiglobus sp.]
MSVLNRSLMAAVGVVALAGVASAQVPGRQIPVVTPPITNPAILRSITPVRTTFVPGFYQPPVWGSWSGPVYPGYYQPPAVVQNSPGRFIRLPDGKVWNPTTGSFYSPWFNTFSGANGTYYPNPWTGTYTNPVTGGSYNPWTNTMARPYLFGTPVSGNPWSN